MATSKLIKESCDKKVLVLFTGGTIGMVKKDGVLGSPNDPQDFENKLKEFPTLYDTRYANDHSLAKNMFPLPECSEGDRIIYKLHSYSQLKDSSNICREDWKQFATDIEREYHHFDGFVIIHGTDTMTYTASVLSFMMENLGKTIVLTGAQVPISQPGSDGIRNLLGAVYIAGHYSIPEVTLFFSNKLLRGNRSVKISSEDFDAFDSPNFPPLIVMPENTSDWYSTLQIQSPQKVDKPTGPSDFRVYKDLSKDIGVLKLFPDISPATVEAFLAEMKGVVLETYGAGNCPSDKVDLLEEIRKACQRGVIIVNCTQCLRGNAKLLYETGSALMNAGVLEGLDMTTEAAFAKLSYILNLNLNPKEKRAQIASNVNGELTENQKLRN